MYTRFGEVPDDVFYYQKYLQEDLAYAQLMLKENISDVERERWEAMISNFYSQLNSLPSLSGESTPFYQESIEDSIVATVSEPTAGEEAAALAGFDLTSNWPILAIVGIGGMIVLRGKKTTGNVRRHRQRRIRKR